MVTRASALVGADDGVAVAAMMALADDESLSHGPLEDRRPPEPAPAAG